MKKGQDVQLLPLEFFNVGALLAAPFYQGRASPAPTGIAYLHTAAAIGSDSASPSSFMAAAPVFLALIFL